MSQSWSVSLLFKLLSSSFLSFLARLALCHAHLQPLCLQSTGLSARFEKAFFNLREINIISSKNPLQKGFELLLFLTRFNRVHQLDIYSVIVWLCGKCATFQANQYVREPYYGQSILVVHSLALVFGLQREEKKNDECHM